MYFILFIVIMIVGLFYNILQTQEIITKQFKLIKLFSGLIYAIGLLVFIFHINEPFLSEAGIYASVILNSLESALSDDADKKNKKIVAVISIILISIQLGYSLI